MVERVTVALDEQLAAEVDAPLSYGDNRSERVRALLRAGLAAEETVDADERARTADWSRADVSHTTEREALVAAAVEIVARNRMVAPRVLERLLDGGDELAAVGISSWDRMLRDVLPSVEGVERDVDAGVYEWTG
jgi:metal-responsive CopG/Arc/MetJ family transcriptional regulator